MTTRTRLTLSLVVEATVSINATTGEVTYIALPEGFELLKTLVIGQHPDLITKAQESVGPRPGLYRVLRWGHPPDYLEFARTTMLHFVLKDASGRERKFRRRDGFAVKRESFDNPRIQADDLQALEKLATEGGQRGS